MNILDIIILICLAAAIVLRAVAIAPTLRARILGGSLPVVSSLRDSTTGYCLSPLSGLQIPLASLAKFRFIGLCVAGGWASCNAP